MSPGFRRRANNSWRPFASVLLYFTFFFLFFLFVFFSAYFFHLSLSLSDFFIFSSSLTHLRWKQTVSRVKIDGFIEEHRTEKFMIVLRFVVSYVKILKKKEIFFFK